MSSRPTISVCLAAYNGERYIEEQLRSILVQLSPKDEVIVVDDGSTDGTADAVSSIHDSRLVLIRGGHNRGLLRTFETALSRSTGEIIFLSDQDDLWLSGKVDRTLDAFSRDPDLVLVATDAVLIDEDGHQIGTSYYSIRGKFQAGIAANLIKCRFLGCTMAFRSRLLNTSLPFPHSKYLHHDIWLGCVNALTSGKVEYLDEALVAYRRHSTNVTGRVKFSSYRRLQSRLHLILALVSTWLGHRREPRPRSDSY